MYRIESKIAFLLVVAAIATVPAGNRTAGPVIDNPNLSSQKTPELDPLGDSFCFSTPEPAYSKPYYGLVGDPAPASHNKFLIWQDDLIRYRVSEIPPASPTGNKFYFSTDGNDANHGLDEESPKQSLEEAQRLIDLANGSAPLNLFFRSGDVWLVDRGLALNNRHIRLGRYGPSDQKPVFNRFNQEYTTGWEEVAGMPDTYCRDESELIGWIYDELVGWDVPFFRVSSLANLSNVPAECTGSFFYDQANEKLYVYLNGTDANTTLIRGLPANDDTGCRLNAHGCRIDGLVFLGFGLNPESTSNQSAGVKVTANGEVACVVADCESYYCSSHAMHFNSGHFTHIGGISTFLRCTAGFCQSNGTPGESIFNSYVFRGSQETIFDECEARFGTLPDDSWFVPGLVEIRGTACFAHTATGKTRLQISRNMKVTGGPFGCSRPCRFSDSPTATTLGMARSYVVGESFDQIRPGAQIDIGNSDGVRMNGYYRAVLANHTSRSWSNSSQVRTWVYNCHFDIDALVNTAGSIAFYNSPAQHTLKAIHCDFIFRVNSNHKVRIPDYRVNNSPGTEWTNCVFAIIGSPQTVSVGYGNPVLANNGYFQTDGQTGNDVQPVAIVNPKELDEFFVPDSGDASYASGAVVADPVAFDRLMIARPNPPSLGDLEGN